MTRILFFLFIFMVGVAVGTQESLQRWLGREAGPASLAAGAPEGAAVITQAVTLASHDRTYRAIGTARARLSVALRPPVAEEVRNVVFSPGELVAKGQLLVVLEDRRERLELERAQVALAEARSLLARFSQAAAKGAVPESEVESARADMREAEVAVQQAELALAQRRITAPFAGVVGLAQVDPGDRVTPETVLTSLDARDQLFLDIAVPEALHDPLEQAVATMQAVPVTTPAYPERRFRARFTARESRISVGARTITARLTLDNRADRLRPGMSCLVRWHISGPSYPSVPEMALQWEREGAFVWVVRGDTATKVAGRVVARQDGNVLFQGPLQEGDAVVVEGVMRLRPDMAVSVIAERGA